MQVDDKLIDYLEEISCFSLSVEEKIRLKGELQNTIDGISCIKNLKTDEAGEQEDNFSPFDKYNIFRDDDVCTSFNRDLILKNAPFKNEKMFIAPKTID